MQPKSNEIADFSFAANIKRCSELSRKQIVEKLCQEECHRTPENDEFCTTAKELYECVLNLLFENQAKWN